MTGLDIAVTVVTFYVGWFGSVLLAPTAYGALSLIFPGALAGFLVVRHRLGLRDAVLALAISTVGLIFDFVMIHFEFISARGLVVFSLPVWLISIWLLFSLSMLKLGTRLEPPIWLSLILGAVMGPLSYKSGELFEVLTFTHPLTVYVYAVFWALAFPAVLKLSKRFA